MIDEYDHQRNTTFDHCMCGANRGEMHYPGCQFSYPPQTVRTAPKPPVNLGTLVTSTEHPGIWLLLSFIDDRAMLRNATGAVEAKIASLSPHH